MGLLAAARWLWGNWQLSALKRHFDCCFMPTAVTNKIHFPLELFSSLDNLHSVGFSNRSFGTLHNEGI